MGAYKELIRHYLVNNSEEVLAKSIKNCHVEGLHSIMLCDSPGKTIRMYICDDTNKLFQNEPYHTLVEKLEMSLGFHSHHCSLTFVVLQGKLGNWIVDPAPPYNLKADKYFFKSKIKEGELKFDLLKNEDGLRTVSNVEYLAGESFYMEANEIHTVHVQFGMVCGWLVIEGKEDGFYNPFLWTNADVNKQDTSNLYQKFDSIYDIKDVIGWMSDYRFRNLIINE